MDTTPGSLLARLRFSDSGDAWDRFVHLFTPLVYGIGRRAGLQPDDARDLVQEVFVLLSRKMRDFEYQPGRSFHAWLRTVTVNKLHELRRRDRWKNKQVDVYAIEQQMDGSQGDELLEEAEYRQQLARRALQLMREEFSPTTWQACWEHVVSGRSAAEVGRELGISEGAVYVAKCRVLKRLRRELAELFE